MPPVTRMPGAAAQPSTAAGTPTAAASSDAPRPAAAPARSDAAAADLAPAAPASPELTRAAVHQPLNAAFALDSSRAATTSRGRAASAIGAPRATTATAAPLRSAWTGAILGSGDLSEASEQRLLQASGDKARILPYGAFDPSRRPVVLVHGINGSPADLKDIANDLRRAGRQVFIVVYDDRGTLTHENGKQLAEALIDLRRTHYVAGTPLDVIAHSMGGIVSRAALDYLQDPHWMGDAGPVGATPRAGFGPVRLRTIDTPWDGAVHEPDFLRGILRPVIRFFMRLFGWLGAFEMRGDSRMFARLYAPQLDGVDLRNVSVRQPGEPDSIRSLPDLSQADRAALGRYIVGGTLPADDRLRNMARSLAQDARFAALRRAVLERLGSQKSAAALAAAVKFAYETVMPRVTGTHVSVLRDDPQRTDDLVDTIVRQLGPAATRRPAEVLSSRF